MDPLPKSRPRASPELLMALREGKAALRRRRERADLREKVRIVLELQQLCFPLLARHRSMAAWERPWAITP